MNIETIVENIIIKGELNRTHYPVTERLEDVNQAQRYLIELANQYGSSFAISNGETKKEEFELLEGDNVFTRTIPFVNITQIEWTNIETPVENDWKILMPGKMLHGIWEIDDMEVIADEKKITVNTAFAGTLRVTYERGPITDFTQADYDNATPPEITWLDKVYIPLLWLIPLMGKLENKAPKYTVIKNQHDILMDLFTSKYKRNAEYNGEIRIIKESNEHR